MNKEETIYYKWLKSNQLINWDEEFKLAHAEKAFKINRFVKFVNKLRETITIDNRKVDKIVDLYRLGHIDIDICEETGKFGTINLDKNDPTEEE